MARQAVRQAAATPQPGRGAKAGWLFIVFLLLLIFSLPTVLLLLFGMLPAIVAYIIDPSKHKTSTICVGTMNFAGVFPYLLGLWTGIHSIDVALGILTDVFALMVMYSAATAGWMVFVAVPPVVGVLLNVMDGRRIEALRARQKRTLKEWGKDVAETAHRA
ncbi:MAG: acyl-CoA synthetase [Alphaproteobacteria bacterium]|nr:acyl-CoA synthetase [Alphaproteobacteria bacterium]